VEEVVSVEVKEDTVPTQTQPEEKQLEQVQPEETQPEEVQPTEDMVNKFNAIIDSFISSEPTTIEEAVSEPVEQVIQNTVVEDVEQISSVETAIEPVEEIVVEDTTTLSEILDTPVLEEATFTEQAKDRFNEIIDQFPTVDEPSVEEPELRTVVEEVVSVEVKEDTVPTQTQPEEVQQTDTVLSLDHDPKSVCLSDIVNEIENNLLLNQFKNSQFELKHLVESSVDTVINKNENITHSYPYSPQNDNDDDFELLNSHEQDEIVYLENLTAPETNCVSSFTEDYDYVQLDIHVDQDYHIGHVQKPIGNVKSESSAKSTSYGSKTKDYEEFSSYTDTGSHQTRTHIDTVFTKNFYESHSNFENRSFTHSHSHPVIKTTHEVNIELPQPRSRTSRHQQPNIEIPIIISSKTPPVKPKRKVSPVRLPVKSDQVQSRLTDLNRLNLDLDQLVSREEKIFDLENSKSNIKPTTSFSKTKKLTSSPNDEKPIVLNKYLDNNETTAGFELIKVSIVNKRPVSPDLDEIINGSDEETYLDKSLGINDDFNKKYDDNNKRLSSLDPSLSYEYENNVTSKNNSFIHNTSMRLTNPFSSDINSSYR